MLSSNSSRLDREDGIAKSKLMQGGMPIRKIESFKDSKPSDGDPPVPRFSTSSSRWLSRNEEQINGKCC